ncbi:Plant transposon protein [Aureococcus anophagefferens]|nr:Plant transposon protein [Aureococcus anophagefferens]
MRDKKPVFPPVRRGDKKTIFVEIKVLMALRWLARGETFDTIGDLSETSETAARVACETWVREFALREWGWVKLNSLHVGKEGYPTRAFNVAVTHTKRIISSTVGHPGARNDKSIVRYDKFVQLVKEKKVLNVSYELDTPDGGVVTEHGAYGIVDGGYHRWRPLQAVEKNASEPQAMHLSKWLESVRKDVECTFGIMKQRHRLLRSRLLLQDRGRRPADVVPDRTFTRRVIPEVELEAEREDAYFELRDNIISTFARRWRERRVQRLQ